MTIAVLTALALTGCVTRTGGQPVADDTVGERPPVTAEVLGDLTTIEPCSLTDPEVFSQFGEAEFGTPWSLDFCVVSVIPEPGTEVFVMVGQLGGLSDGPEPRKLEDVSDGVHTAKPSNEGDPCAEFLVFAEDDLMLAVSGAVRSGTSTAVCEMVSAGMDKVIAVVEDGAVAHRYPTPDSLIPLDPCDLVTDETVTALPGFEAAKRTDYPGGHQCHWDASPGDDGHGIRVEFGVGVPPNSYGSTRSTIAGRPTVTSQSQQAGSPDHCYVRTGHIAFTDFSDKPGLVELVRIVALVPAGRVRAGCQAALAVARALWPRLPPI